MYWGAWLDQSVEHRTLNLKVMSSSPAFVVELTKKTYCTYLFNGITEIKNLIRIFNDMERCSWYLVK